MQVFLTKRPEKAHRNCIATRKPAVPHPTSCPLSGRSHQTGKIVAKEEGLCL